MADQAKAGELEDRPILTSLRPLLPSVPVRVVCPEAA